MQLPAAPTDAGNPDKALLRKIGRQVRRRLDTDPRMQRIASDRADIWAMGGFLTALECDRLIALIDANALPSMIGAEQYSRAHRTSDSADLNPGDPLVAAIHHRIDEALGMPPGRGETLQGQRYRAGQEFKPHVDWFVPHTDAWAHYHADGGQRSFTAMAFLNDVTHGGETDFPALDVAVQPRGGALLVWNNADDAGVPNPFTLHAGNPVAAGVKYIVTRWYRCARWRGTTS